MIRDFEVLRPRLEVLCELAETSDRTDMLIKAQRFHGGLDSANFSRDEVKTFRRSLDEVRVLEIWNRHKSNEREPNYFVTSKRGWPSPWSCKGYAWFPDPSPLLPHPVVASLDAWPREKGPAFRHIQDNWYLFFSPL